MTKKQIFKAYEELLEIFEESDIQLTHMTNGKKVVENEYMIFFSRNVSEFLFQQKAFEFSEWLIKYKKEISGLYAHWHRDLVKGAYIYFN